MKRVHLIIVIYLFTIIISFGQTIRFYGHAYDIKDSVEIPFTNISVLDSNTCMNKVLTNFDGEYEIIINKATLNKVYKAKATYLYYEPVIVDLIFVEDSSNFYYDFYLTPIESPPIYYREDIIFPIDTYEDIEKIIVPEMRR